MRIYGTPRSSACEKTKTLVRLCGRPNARDLWHIATYNLTVFLPARIVPLSLIFGIALRYISGKTVAAVKHLDPTTAAVCIKLGTMSDIFISYKREEQAQARKLANALEREGWTVWWDPKLRAGDDFDKIIEAVLNESRCVIVLWSEKSLASDYVRAEASEAMEQKKLVPVAIENVTLPFRFKRLHTPILLNWDGSNESVEFRKLVEDITAKIGKSAGKPSADAPTAFLSYASDDTAAVNALADDLRQGGIAVWEDKQNLRAGDDWKKVLRYVIGKHVDYFVFVQSAHVMRCASGVFYDELCEALDRQRIFKEGLRFIMPVQLGPCEIEPRIAGLHCIDVSTPDGIGKLVDDIMEDYQKRQTLWNLAR